MFTKTVSLLQTLLFHPCYVDCTTVWNNNLVSSVFCTYHASSYKSERVDILQEWYYMLSDLLSHEYMILFTLVALVTYYCYYWQWPNFRCPCYDWLKICVVVMPFRGSPYLDGGTDNLFQHITSNRQFFYPFLLSQSTSFSVINTVMHGLAWIQMSLFQAIFVWQLL